MRVIKHEYGYNPEHYPYAVFFENSKKITKLLKKRRDLFCKHLSNLINETMSEFTGKDHIEKEILTEENCLNRAAVNEFPFEALACSICRGGCCKGKEHAFLKKDTILRYLSMHPDYNFGQVLDAYMARLPENSFEGSCVNHAQTGCTLPRHMRSSVCNDYLCERLSKLRDLFTATPVPKGVFFIHRAQLDTDNSIVASELILNEISYGLK